MFLQLRSCGSLLLLPALLVLVSRAQGQVEWQRTGENPVLTAGEPGEWDSGTVTAPFVVFERGTYQMWYTGFLSVTQGGEIGLATSSNGIDWDKSDTSPVLKRVPGTWEDGTYASCVFGSAGAGYHMWYGGADNQAKCQIGHATSEDGIHWIRQEPALTVGAGGQAWEQNCIDNPRVVWDGKIYRMWYIGGGNDFRTWHIGLATSLDALHWTRYQGNPVLNLDRPDNPTGLLTPSVLLDEKTGMFEMWYSFNHFAVQDGAAIGYATSADGMEWCVYEINPVLSGDGGTWDAGFTDKASVLFDGTQYVMWYAGGSGNRSLGIGRATAARTIPMASFIATPRDSLECLTVDVDGSRSATPSPAPAIVRYDWDFGDGSLVLAVQSDPKANHAYASPGHYVVRLTVTDSAGKKAAVTRGVDVSSPSCDVAPWSVEQIGAPLFAGNVCRDGLTGCLELVAGGHFLAGTSDQITFVEQPVSGDVVLTARVHKASGAENGWQVGVMLRESLDAGSRHVSMVIHQDGTSRPPRFLAVNRSGSTGSSSKVGDNAALADAWVRVERRGEVFITSSSTDSESWKPIQTVILANCPATVLGGVVAIGRDLRLSSPFLALNATVCDITTEKPGTYFHRGDPDSSGTTDISDGIAIFGFLFLGDPPTISCRESADANNDGTIDISDGIYILSWLFIGGPEPASPGPTGMPCGLDPDPPGSPGDLGCEAYSACH